MSDAGRAGRRRLPSTARRRSLIAAYTRLRPVPGVPEIRLHLADETEPVWRATDAVTRGAPGGPAGDPRDTAPIPFWAFAWSGGLAIARHILDRPDEARGRRVLDLGTGSGLVAIAAALVGAATVRAVDVDPFAETAAAMNARANGVELDIVRGDLLVDPPPHDVDLLLAADTWYEGPLAERVQPWLRAAASDGARVLVGDPGRRYLPVDALEPIATYEVETTTELEDRAVVTARVFLVRP